MIWRRGSPWWPGEVRESQLLGEKDEAPEQMLMTAMDVLEAACATLFSGNMVQHVGHRRQCRQLVQLFT